MIFSSLGFCIVQALVKYLDTSVSSWTKAFYRSFFGIIFLLIWMLYKRKKFVFNNKPILFVRGFAGGLSLAFSFWCIDTYDLAHATFYLYTFPIFAPIFSALFFKENFKLAYIIPLITAFAGIVLNSSINEFSFSHKDIIGLLSGITAGIAISTLKTLRKTNDAEIIYFSFTFISIFVCILGIIFQKEQYFLFPVTTVFSFTQAFVLLLLIGFFATISQVLMTTSYKTLSTALASILSLLTMPIVTVIAIFIFKEQCHILNLIGGLLIFLSGIAVALIDNKTDYEKDF